MVTVPVPVRNISLETAEEHGMEFDDGERAEREAYGVLIRNNLLSSFTTKQRRVLSCIYEEGMTRKEAAVHLMVSVQSIHQIIGRMKQRAMIFDETIVRNLVFFFLLTMPNCTVDMLITMWKTHVVLRDYPEPDKELLIMWHRRFNRTVAI